MKIKMLFVLLVGICISVSQGNAHSESKPTHHIVWIHGIGGNAAQAGYMKESLEKYLPLMNSSMNYEVSYFDYATKNDQLTVGDFKDHFDTYLQNKFLVDKKLRKNDQISIIAHSQGGIITMYWLGSACFDSSKPSFYICSKIKSLTTLGTPFWGSRFANLAEELKKWIGNVGIMKDYGLNQLMALSVASPAIYKMRDLWESRKADFEKLFNNQIRLSVVAGKSAFFDMLSPFYTGENLEDDLGVPVTSSNPSHYLYSGQILGHDDKTLRTHIVPFKFNYVIVDAVHIPQLPNLIKENLGENVAKWIPNIPYPSLIDIPEDCMDRSPDICNSPTLKHVAQNILGIRKKTEIPKLNSFAIQIRLKANSSKEINEYIRFKITEINSKIKVGKWTEPYSNVRQVIDDTVYGYVTGSHLSFAKQQQSRNVNLEIYFGNKSIHKAQLTVTPGVTTFVDLKINNASLEIMFNEMNQIPSGSALNYELGISEVPL